jgi:hypothetical protein
MRAQIRLILADSDEAASYIASCGEGTPAPFPGRKLADLRTTLNLAGDLSSAPSASFVSESLKHDAEVAAYLSKLPRIPVVLGEGVADASEGDRIFALHQMYYDSPEEAERITRRFT